MINSINSGKFANAEIKTNRNLKTTPVYKLQNNANANYTKIPPGLLQVTFLGIQNYPVNPRREYRDYGDKLYIGPAATTGYTFIIRDRAKARYVDLEGKDLSNYSFVKSGFYKANLSKTKLENTIFEHSNLWGVNLKGAKTKNTSFCHTNLCDADLSGAEFGRNTDMYGANLMGANLSNTNLTYVNLTNALYNKTTIFPDNMEERKLKRMILVEDGADLSNLDLEYSKMRYLTINNANFENSSLKRADMKAWEANRCNFKNIDLTRAYAREMVATNCDFSGADMTQTNFDKAVFNNVNMRNVDLSGAIFTFKEANGLILEGAKYDQYTIFNDDFDPKAHGMIYSESYLNEYDINY